MPADLHRVRYLLEAIDRGSFSSAATSLGVAQTALGRHVAELERLYGQRLLHRTGRGVVPTAFAENFLPRMRSLVREADRLFEDICAASDQVAGRIRLGLIQSVGAYIITPLLREVSAKHPRIEISIRDGLTEHINEWLADGHIDIGVNYAGHADRRTVDALIDIDFYLVGAAGDPNLAEASCTLERAAAFQFVLPHAHQSLRAKMEHVFASCGLRLQVAIETDSVQTSVDLVRTPGLYTLVPLHLATHYVRAGTLAATKIVEPVITRQLILLHRLRKPVTPAVKVVAEILRRQVPAQVLAGEIPGARVATSEREVGRGADTFKQSVTDSTRSNGKRSADGRA